MQDHIFKLPTISCLVQNVSDDFLTYMYMYVPCLVYRLYLYLTILNKNDVSVNSFFPMSFKKDLSQVLCIIEFVLRVWGKRSNVRVAKYYIVLEMAL